jgi:hypothetical protein
MNLGLVPLRASGAKAHIHLAWLEKGYSKEVRGGTSLVVTKKPCMS